jgi:DUF1680 family protein
VISRRRFLQSASVTAVAATTPARTLARAFRPTPAPAIATRFSPLAYDQIQFVTEPAQSIPNPQSQLEQTHALLMGLDEDALLFPFRKLSRLPAPGTSLPGWYAIDGYAPGHCFGQWISALSRYTAITNDSATRARVHRLVQLYAATVTSDGAFFNGNRFPAYTYDKLVLALLDAHTLAACPEALPTLAGLTRAANPFLPATALTHKEMCELPHKDPSYCADESYTLAENQFLAYRITGDPAYLNSGRRFLLDKEFNDPLSRNENALIGLHAYSHMNALSSAAQAYLTLGDPKYLRAATNGFRFVQQQSFATGGWGPNEEFFDPSTNPLADRLTDTHRGFETPCGSYAHAKLASYLLRITGDSTYGDSVESVFYNTTFGALPLHHDGRAFYYADYNWQSTKGFFPDLWPCCAGTLPMVTADYRVHTAFTEPSGLAVNLFLPATLRFAAPSGQQFALTQSGSYPCESHIAFQLASLSSRAAAHPEAFTIRFRIPAWATGAELRINDRKTDTPLEPGTFATITRTWSPGDRIDLELPLPMRLAQLDPQHPNIVALQRGPLCLFAVTDAAKSVAITRQQLLAAQPTSSSAREFTAQTAAGPLKLVPFTALNQDEPYSLYLNVTS